MRTIGQNELDVHKACRAALIRRRATIERAIAKLDIEIANIEKGLEYATTKCPVCSGARHIDGDTCVHCNGAGQLRCLIKHRICGLLVVTCPLCHGFSYPKGHCTYCHSKGAIAI